LSVKIYASRVAMVCLLMAIAIPIADEPTAFAAEQIEITVDVEGACAGNTYNLEYSPSLSSTIDFPLYAGDGFAQRVEIDLDIDPGQDAECNELHGYVTFVESGFEDANIESTFDCDASPITLTGDVYTCDATSGSPDAVGVSVEALTGAQIGRYTNVITLTLIPVGP
jgi:hypothetical protein